MQKFSKQMQDDGVYFTHGVYQKTSIKTELFFLLTEDTFFCKTNAGRFFTHGGYQRYVKTELFLVFTVDTIFF